MINLDNNFLVEIGLGGMPDGQKTDFLKFVFDQLEKRVGEILSSNMTTEQIQEFDKILKNDNGFISRWLTEHVPTYLSDNLFENMQESSGLDQNDPKLISDYVSAKWLLMNCPAYPQVVANEVQKMRREIISNRDKLA